MTLGARIAQQRSLHKMSQGDLAEALDVSRQAVSKWETDASVPELEKLLKMSEAFQISLDALVKGEQAQEKTAEPSEPKQSVRSEAVSTQRIIGFILIGVGLFSTVLTLLFGLLMLIVGVFFTLCGWILVKGGRYAGISILWGTLAIVMPFLSYATAIQMRSVFDPRIYMGGQMTLQLIIAAVLWVIVIGTAAVTMRLPVMRGHKWLVVGWAMALVMHENLWSIAYRVIAYMAGLLLWGEEWWHYARMSVAVVVHIVVIVATIKWVKENKSQKSEKNT